MKVTNVSLCATEQSKAAGRPALTPELMAACGARYSRNNEGLEAILEKIDPNNTDKSVDGIFKMVDYGHASIADMTPVSMFIDNISILQAYLLWSWCPTAGGQESSTRYIKISRDGLVDPNLFGLPPEDHEKWSEFMMKCFDAYNKALTFWEAQVAEKPSLAKIPTALLEDSSDKAQKTVARMKRNYAFDRSRYFLPAAALTNMMMVMSARGWVQLCQNLLSHWLPECVALGEKIKEELKLSAPRMVKHAEAKESFAAGHHRELITTSLRVRSTGLEGQEECDPKINIFPPKGVSDEDLASGLVFHDNRYAYIGTDVCRTGVRFSWSAVSIAEIRDFNRHRTGQKYCPLCPVGFYHAIDQEVARNDQESDAYDELAEIGSAALNESRKRLAKTDKSFVSWILLGHQFEFEHTTTLDKFVYEAELRTGTGAHYRYADHIRDVVEEIRRSYPLLANTIRLGTSEPE